MAVSFGSVGDIIAVCLLIKDLVDTFDSSRGSAAEYQGLVRELGGLERCLLEVDLLSRSDTSPDIVAICEAAKLSIADCQIALEGLSTRMHKYGRYLGDRHPESGKFLADAAMKIRWQISEKDTIKKFRATITTHTSALNMLLATANVKLNEKNASKIDSLQTTCKDGFNGALIRVHDRLDENALQISECKSILGHISEGINWIRQVCLDMQASLKTLLSLGTQVHSAVMDIQQAQLSSQMERVLIDEPFILEDAIGRRAPVHLQFVSSWDALHAVLEIRFRALQGADKVERKEYCLQNRATGREIARTRPWEGAFLPGQRIDMSFVFERKRSSEKTTDSTCCPSCHKAFASRSPGVDIECPHCGLFYRRVEEVEEVDSVPPESVFIGPLPEPWRTIPVFGQSAFPAAPRKPKRKAPASEVHREPSMPFKRIKIVSKELRVKAIGFDWVGELHEGSSSDGRVRAHNIFAGSGIPKVANRSPLEECRLPDLPVDFLKLKPVPRRAFRQRYTPSHQGKPEKVLAKVSTEYRGLSYGRTLSTTFSSTVKSAFAHSTWPVKVPPASRLCAVKIVKRTPRSAVASQYPYGMAGLRDHPHAGYVAILWGTFLHDDNLHLVSELAQGGKLVDLARSEKGFAESVAKSYGAQVARGLSYLHLQNIYYGSVRPDKILVDNKAGHIKLVGFWPSMPLGNMKIYQQAHVLSAYTAPEVVTGPDEITVAADWWSWGVLLFEMLTGASPFVVPSVIPDQRSCSDDVDRCLKSYEENLKIPVDYPGFISADAKDLMQSVLVREPRLRLGGGSGDALAKIVGHSWF